MDQKSNKWLLFFIGLAVLVNLSGLFIPLMEPDACVYAIVSKNMVLRNDWVNLYFNGGDWLDKPHLPFWITAAFFKVFGIHNWSYKLPAILFVFLAARYTYLFARIFYGKTIALWSVLVLLTAEHIILTNNDVRAEPYLTAFIIAAVYHFRKTLVKEKLFLNLVIASLFTAGALMTKGLFTLIPIAGAIAGELIIKQQWRDLFNWKWLAALILITIFITPELYCLWLQFDSHPEKTVLGKTGVSGIRFFLWDSQFGRFSNTGPYKGEGSPFFFLHTLLWAFLPWCLLMYGAIVHKFGKFDPELRKKEEWFTFYGVFFTLLVFSFSSFQLPHYTNIIFPMMAILTARYMNELKGKAIVIFRVIQNIIALLFIITAFVLFQLFYSSLLPPVLLVIVLVFFFVLLVGLPWWFKENKLWLSFFRSATAVMIFNLFLNLCFYPDLLKYESGTQAALYINNNYPGTTIISPSIYSPAFEFYFNGTSQKLMDQPAQKSVIYFVTQQELDSMKSIVSTIEVIKEFPEFHVTTLSGKFLNKNTRDAELKKYYLVKMGLP